MIGIIPAERDADWRSEAMCTQSDPELWFAEPGGNATPAKKLCALCPVRLECLRYAIDERIDYGVYGGLYPVERRRLARDRSNR